MKKLALALLCISQSSFATPTPPVSRDIDYQQLNDILTLSTKIQSPYAKIKSAINVKKKGLALNQVKLSLLVGQQKPIAISINEKGEISLPVLDATQAKIAKLHMNQAKDDVSLSISPTITVPTQTTVPYYDLFILLNDSNVFIKKMAGMASWFVPSMDRLEFKFSAPATITINSKKQHYQYQTDKHNKIKIKIKKQLLDENPNVVFSQLPNNMSPED